MLDSVKYDTVVCLLCGC